MYMSSSKVSIAAAGGRAGEDMRRLCEAVKNEYRAQSSFPQRFTRRRLRAEIQPKKRASIGTPLGEIKQSRTRLHQDRTKQGQTVCARSEPS